MNAIIEKENKVPIEKKNMPVLSYASQQRDIFGSYGAVLEMLTEVLELIE